MTEIVEVLVPESPQIIEVQVPGLQGPAGPEGPPGSGEGGGGITDGDKGDITVTGTGATWTIDANSVSNTKLADMNPDTIKGNNGGAFSDPIDLTSAQVSSMLNGTIQPYWLNIVDKPETLAGYGIIDAAPLIHEHSAADITSGVFEVARLPAFTGGDVTASAGSMDLQIVADVVTNVELANMPSNTLKGNNTGITGDPLDLSAADVSAMLSGLVPPIDHTHAWTEITATPTTLLGYGITDAVGISQKGAPNGVVPLTSGAKIDPIYLSSANITDVFVVANETEQLALAAGEGDVAVRTDEATSYIHNGGSTASMLDWTELLSPTGGDAVTSVAGRIGDIVLTTADIVSGTFLAARLPAYTGDVISAIGTTVNTIPPDTVVNSKLANMPGSTLKGNNTLGVGDPLDLTPIQVGSMLSGQVVPAAHSHSAGDITSGTLAASVMPALSGDVLAPANTAVTSIANDVVTNAKLANMPGTTIKGNNSASPIDPMDLTPSQVGSMLSGLVNPAAHVHSAAQITSGTLSGTLLPAFTGGDVTSAIGSVALTIANDAVTNVKLANMGAATIKGALVAGDPIDLTSLQATALLDVFTSALKGLVPPSGGGTLNFLRADGTFALPPGSGGGGVGEVFAYPAGRAMDGITDVGDTYTNQGATEMAPFELPEAAAGLEYTFIVQGLEGLSVHTQSGDTINLAGVVFYDIESVLIGSSVTIVAINSDEWVATSLLGTWSAGDSLTAPVGLDFSFATNSMYLPLLMEDI